MRGKSLQQMSGKPIIRFVKRAAESLRIKTMEPNQEIKDFLEDLKRFTGRDLHFARELGILMEAVRQTGMIGDFDDILFRSKFTVKTIELIKRIGPNAEGAGEARKPSLRRGFRISLFR